MTFNDSLMSRMLKEPVEMWKENSVYHFILKLPYVILILTLGIGIALVVDLMCSLDDLQND